MAYLEINKGKAVVQSALKDEPMSIGRLPGNSIVINDPDISRRHCVIERWEGKFSIYDLGSRNGTVVNGQRVQRTELKPGDVITLGGTIARFLEAPTQALPRMKKPRKWLIWVPTLTVFLVAAAIVAWATGMFGPGFTPFQRGKSSGVVVASRPVETQPDTALPDDSSSQSLPGAEAVTDSPASPPSTETDHREAAKITADPTIEPDSERVRYQWLSLESAARQADRLIGRAVAGRFVGRPSMDDLGRLAWELPPDGEITAVLEADELAARQVLAAIAAEPRLLEADLSGVLQRDRDGSRLLLRVGVIELQHALGKRDDSLLAATRELLGTRIVLNRRYTAETIDRGGN